MEQSKQSLLHKTRVEFESEMFISFLICVFYGSSAIIGTLTNKYLYSNYNFRLYAILFLLQQLFVLFVYLLFSVLPKSFIKSIFQIDKVTITFRILWTILPLSFFTLLNTLGIFLSLSIVNVPMFLALRRTSIVFILGLDVLIKRKCPHKYIIFSVLLMVIGSVLAAVYDYYFDFVGYIVIFGCNILTAIQFHLTHHLGNECNFNPLVILFSNSISMLPFLVIIAYFLGEFQQFYHYPHFDKYDFNIFLTMTTFSGFLIVYSQMLCNIYNTPMTTGITANTKDAVLTIIGLFAFNDVQITFVFIAGLFISLVGTAVYGYIKVVLLTADFEESEMLSKLDIEEKEKFVIEHFEKVEYINKFESNNIEFEKENNNKIDNFEENLEKSNLNNSLEMQK